MCPVVNCFQKSYLWLLNTTHQEKGCIGHMLWIAFKNLIFDYWTQLQRMVTTPQMSCELLSKILSLTIEHNILSLFASMTTVVNCFQKSYLWLLNTTGEDNQYLPTGLWIAFKNLIFDYWTQQKSNPKHRHCGCELLSKILSLTIEHNNPRLAKWSTRVVNCFQKSYLWLLNTTRYLKSIFVIALWIAFKNLIFDYWTQPSTGNEVLYKRCELLSKILSLTIEHNSWTYYTYINTVVNCFQKSYLWLLNTTNYYLYAVIF